MKNTNTLKAKVEAVNEANTCANMLKRRLDKVFLPLVGRAIVKSNGDLLKRTEAWQMVDEIHGSNSRSQSIYRSASNYSLAWTVRTCVSIEDSHVCVYHETTVYIGKLNGTILSGIDPESHYKTDYTVDDIIERRAAYVIAKKAADNAYSDLFPFGEYDG